MDDTFSTDELKLAFGYHLVQQIIGSDGVMSDDERWFVERTFPAALLDASGFRSEDGRFTGRWQAALGEALLQLPELPVADRVALIDTLFDAAVADSAFLNIEAETVRRAARLLALGEAQIGELMARWDTVEADRPEGT